MDFEIKQVKRHWFYMITGIVGATSFVWTILIYRKTVIDKEILIFITILIGFIFMWIDLKNYANTYALINWKKYAFCFSQNIMSWGFLTCFAFIFINFHFRSDTVEHKEYPIVEKASMPGASVKSMHQPLIMINYEGEIKELVFEHRFLKDIEKYNYVILATTKGYFNFDVIKYQKLKV